MRDLADLRDLTSVLATQTLLRTAATQELASAQAAETACAGEEEAALGHVEQAFSFWQARLSLRAFDPDALSRLAADVNAKGHGLEIARAHHAEARRRTEAARLRFATLDAQAAQCEERIERLRRRIRYRQDERRQSALEDRIAQQWVKS
jgi:hypothetical protein